MDEYIICKCDSNNSKESIQLCMNFIESFIEHKKTLESVNPTIDYNKKPDLRGWGGYHPNLLLREENRAKIQKEKNAEFLPSFQVIYKALKVIQQNMG